MHFIKESDPNNFICPIDELYKNDVFLKIQKGVSPPNFESQDPKFSKSLKIPKSGFFDLFAKNVKKKNWYKKYFRPDVYNEIENDESRKHEIIESTSEKIAVEHFY